MIMAIAAAVYKPKDIGIKKARPASGRPNAYRRGYGGYRWEITRRRVFRRDNYMCQICGQICVEGCQDADRWPNCDHIIPKPIGTNEESNLQTLCGHCHSLKTSKELIKGG